MNDHQPDLTLEQKASLLSGGGFWTSQAIPEAGIPSIILTDGPHGIRRQADGEDHLGINDSVPSTCFPPAVAVGSSWDTDAAARIGAAVGSEGRAFGVSVVLGPGINIKRSPLCGRNFEYYSEDPLLSGALGTAHVRALQAQGPGASVKHFAANNQETDRMSISSDVDARTLREIYLPAFETVVKDSAPATVMCSYNRINGVPASHDPWLLTQLLRDEWGFEGAVISDWGAVSDRVAGVAAGMDLEMPGSGGTTDAQIIDAVRGGRLDADAVDTAARRVLALTQLPSVATDTFDFDAHHRLAREVAADAIVLLKNDASTLPLEGALRIAVIGAFATQPRFQGGGSSHVNPTRVDTALREIEILAAHHGASVDFASGFALDSNEDQGALRSEAIERAGIADVSVIFAGLSDRDESEGFDRETLELPAAQVQLIKQVAAVSAKTVVVLSNGGIVTMEGWHDDVDAIVEGFVLGQASGGALADVLFGVVNPSGRLAETIPVRLEDNPSWLNFPGEQGHVRYGEGVFVGYRYYATAGVPVRYPFGHGLSYTSFQTGPIEVEATADDAARARVRVSNTGARRGKHVVQLYVSTEAGPVRRPVRELKGFQKIDLAPGESATVEFELDRRSFAYWDVEIERWVVATGDYTVQIANDAHTVLSEATITLAGDSVHRPLTLDSTVGTWFAHPVAGPALMQGLSSGAVSEQDRADGEDSMRMVESMPMRQFLTFLNGAIPPAVLEDLIRLSAEPSLSS